MIQKLIQRVINILVKPVDEWKKIQQERWTVQGLFLNYALLLGAIPAVAGFIGYALVGQSVMGFTFRVPFGNAITWMVLQYVFSMGVVFAVAFIMDALAPTFGAKKDLLSSFKVVVFSWTAAWVGGIFSIIPTMAPLSLLAAIYTLVLLYFGMKAIRKVPSDRLIGYYVTTLVIALVVFMLAGFIVGAIALPSAGAAAASMSAEAFRGGMGG
jgi:hypothetical protein